MRKVFVRATLDLLALALLLPPVSASAQLPPNAASASSSREDAGSRSDYIAAVEAARGRLTNALESAQADYDTVRAVFEEASAGLSEERRAQLASSGPLLEARQAYFSRRDSARANFKNEIEAGAKHYGDAAASVFATAVNALGGVHAGLDIYEAVSTAIESDQGAVTEARRRHDRAVEAARRARRAAINRLEDESTRSIDACEKGERATGRAQRLRCCKGCGIGTRWRLGGPEEESALEATFSAALAAADARLGFALAEAEADRAIAHVTAREATVVASEEELAEVESVVVSGVAAAIGEFDLEGLGGIAHAAARAAITEALSAYGNETALATARTSILDARAALEEAVRIYNAAPPVSIDRALEALRTARDEFIVGVVTAEEKFFTFDDRLDAEREVALEAARSLRKERRRRAAEGEAWRRHNARWDAAVEPARQVFNAEKEATRVAFRDARRAVREEAENHERAVEAARVAIRSMRQEVAAAIEALGTPLGDQRARLNALESHVQARVRGAASF